LGKVDACIVGKVTGKDEKESFRDDGIAEHGGILSTLDVLELRSEAFESVEEFRRFLGFFRATSHPCYLGVLEDGL
jgi:hypothetical protein